MHYNDIKRLIEIVEESSIQELEVTTGEDKVRITRIARQPPVVTQPPPYPYPFVYQGFPGSFLQTPPGGRPEGPQAPVESAGTAVPQAREATGAEAKAEEAAPPRNDAQIMKSPMVGTFYRAASPNLPPFVEVGDSVRKGDILCIIEAMKLMNEIESDRDGVVVDILKNNGEPVEYGEDLFQIR